MPVTKTFMEYTEYDLYSSEQMSVAVPSRDFFLEGADPEVAAAFEASLATLRGLGAEAAPKGVPLKTVVPVVVDDRRRGRGRGREAVGKPAPRVLGGGAEPVLHGTEPRR